MGSSAAAHGSKFAEQQIFARWYPEQSQPRQYHPFCNNANAAIRRSAWEKHPYDETLPGLEDLAWAKWVIDQSYGIAYIAEAEIVHVHDETPRGVYNRYRREAMAFKRIFPGRAFSPVGFYLVGDYQRDQRSMACGSPTRITRDISAASSGSG